MRLTEVEAYEGADDPASHAFRGLTRRTAVMFGPAGHLYCYFTYGMHWCANIVCGTDGHAAAVLLRAGEIVRGRRRRPRAAAGRASQRATWPAGRPGWRPASAWRAATNGVDLCAPASPVRLESMRARRVPGVLSGPRVGIAVATERPWRFWLSGDPTVSAFKAGGATAPDRQTSPVRSPTSTTCRRPQRGA